MISIPMPFSLLFLPLYPFLLLFKWEKFNTVLLIIQHLPVALVGIIAWILHFIIQMPIVYLTLLKLKFESFLMGRVGFFKFLAKISVAIFAGIIITVIIGVLDFIQFVKNLWKTDLPTTKHENDETYKPLTPEGLKVLNLTLIDLSLIHI